ncbi:hypothetical protein LINPERPRIM_LOCUS30497, partial [Linum perenne]
MLASSITAPPTTTFAITTTATLDDDDKKEQHAKVGVDVAWQSQSDKQHSSPLKPQEDHELKQTGLQKRKLTWTDD